MIQAQAIIHTCIDFRIQKPLQEFIENQLNLYAADFKTDSGGVKMIFEEGPIREWVFENFKTSIDSRDIQRIILINHTDCLAYSGSDAFENLDEEIRHHEIQLRHAVSDTKARFPDQQVEAYLFVLGGMNEPSTIRQVV